MCRWMQTAAVCRSAAFGTLILILPPGSRELSRACRGRDACITSVLDVWAGRLAFADAALDQNIYVSIVSAQRSGLWAHPILAHFRQRWPGLRTVDVDGCAWQSRGPFARRTWRFLSSSPWVPHLRHTCRGDHVHSASQCPGSEEAVGRACGVAHASWVGWPPPLLAGPTAAEIPGVPGPA